MKPKHQVILLLFSGVLLFLACVDPKMRSKVEQRSQQTETTLEALQEELRQEEENIERLKLEIETAEAEYRQKQEEQAFVVLLPEEGQKNTPHLPSGSTSKSLQQIWMQDSLPTEKETLPLRHLVKVQESKDESVKNWLSQFESEESFYTPEYFIRFVQFSGNATGTENTIDLFILIQPSQLDGEVRAFSIRGLFNPEIKAWKKLQDYTYIPIEHGIGQIKTDTLWINPKNFSLGRPALVQ